jgi:hypothetical protein
MLDSVAHSLAVDSTRGGGIEDAVHTMRAVIAGFCNHQLDSIIYHGQNQRAAHVDILCSFLSGLRCRQRENDAMDICRPIGKKNEKKNR